MSRRVEKMVAESHAIERRNAALARGGRKTAGTFCSVVHLLTKRFTRCCHVVPFEGVGEIIVSRNLLFYSIVKGIKVFAYSGQFKQFWKPLDDC